MSNTKSKKSAQQIIGIMWKMTNFLISGIIFAFFLYTLAVTARSVSESSLQGSQQNNQLVSNSRQNGNRSMQSSNGGYMNGSQNRCLSGWIWFNNKCWIALISSRRNHSDAINLCRKFYNATLPTIHSEEENEFLRSHIDLSNSPIWLFARHNHQYNKTRWLDKTPVNYTKWDAGQPNDKLSLICIKTADSWYMKKAEPNDGQTECISFWDDAKWGTQVSCEVFLPVVCEKKLTSVSRSIDGQTGVSSQYELQQMAPVSGAQSILMKHQYRPLLILMNVFAIIIMVSLQNQRNSAIMIQLS